MKPFASSLASIASSGAASTDGQHSSSALTTALASPSVDLPLTDINASTMIIASTIVDAIRRSAMSRVQLALNVSDLDAAVDFYSKLFGTEPAKRRPATPTSPSPSRR